MAVHIGVIGTGMIGQDHIRRLTQVLAGAQVVAVSDMDAARASEVASALPAPARVHATGQEVVADPGVDAVLVTSWGGSHEEYVLAALAAGKPVFCEKPLADTLAACERILDAEVAGGRKLVQVGFMRRYDPAYRAMKAVVDSGDIGAPLIMHCGHRNPAVPSHYTKDMAIVDTAVHEVDVVRWLFGEEIVATQVLVPRRSKNGGGGCLRRGPEGAPRRRPCRRPAAPRAGPLQVVPTDRSGRPPAPAMSRPPVSTRDLALVIHPTSPVPPYYQVALQLEEPSSPGGCRSATDFPASTTSRPRPSGRSRAGVARGRSPRRRTRTDGPAYVRIGRSPRPLYVNMHKAARGEPATPARPSAATTV